VADVVATIAPQVRVRLARAGIDDDLGADVSAEAEPGLAGLAAAVQGVLALGGVSGRRQQRLGHGDRRTSEDAPLAERPDMPHARWEGFDLHAAGSWCQATGRGWSACVGTSCPRR
jgi:hypothetical protein